MFVLRKGMSVFGVRPAPGPLRVDRERLFVTTTSASAAVNLKSQLTAKLIGDDLYALCDVGVGACKEAKETLELDFKLMLCEYFIFGGASIFLYSEGGKNFPMTTDVDIQFDFNPYSTGWDEKHIIDTAYTLVEKGILSRLSALATIDEKLRRLGASPLEVRRGDDRVQLITRLSGIEEHLLEVIMNGNRLVREKIGKSPTLYSEDESVLHPSYPIREPVFELFRQIDLAGYEGEVIEAAVRKRSLRAARAEFLLSCILEHSVDGDFDSQHKIHEYAQDGPSWPLIQRYTVLRTAYTPKEAFESLLREQYSAEKNKAITWKILTGVLLRDFTRKATAQHGNGTRACIIHFDPISKITTLYTGVNKTHNWSPKTMVSAQFTPSESDMRQFVSEQLPDFKVQSNTFFEDVFKPIDIYDEEEAGRNHATYDGHTLTISQAGRVTATIPLPLRYRLGTTPQELGDLIDAVDGAGKRSEGVRGPPRRAT